MAENLELALTAILCKETIALFFLSYLNVLLLCAPVTLVQLICHITTWLHTVVTIILRTTHNLKKITTKRSHVMHCRQGGGCVREASLVEERDDVNKKKKS